ncbi:MAG: hypothetical protein V3V96_04820 [Acidiferrobacterales bacterium]
MANFVGEFLSLGLIEDAITGEILLPIIEATMEAEQIRLCADA